MCPAQSDSILEHLKKQEGMMLAMQAQIASLRGCRLEIITDQDPCKSDLELFFGKSFNADNFYFYAD